ncbi:hypothetical protein [Streptomyces niveus]|uniref:hypothetical protein n=1 Tax=Streptomyces niveus TaxID=193462 RepID=UPI00344C3563
MTRRVGLVDLPVTFARPLRLFTYIIGHSQLPLRGEQNHERGRTTTLEVVRFEPDRPSPSEPRTIYSPYPRHR